MKQTTKRLLSIALCALLLLSLLPLGFLGRQALASPDGLHRLSLVGSGFPGIEEWNPAAPEGEMTEVSNNVYEKLMTFPEDTTICFKVVGNGCWDDNWNFGSVGLVPGELTEMECGGSSQDMVLSVAGGSRVKFTVDLNGLSIGHKATILVKVQGPVDGFKTVYAKADWSQCYVYCWNADGSALAGNWPGTQMFLNEDGLWEGKVTAKASNLLFNNGEGGEGNQTTDLTMPHGNEIVYLYASDCWVTYQEAVGAGNWGIESLSMVGSCLPGLSDWDDTSLSCLMEERSENIYVRYLEMQEATTLTFRFAGNSGADDQWDFGGANVVLGQAVALSRGVYATDMILSVDGPCALWFVVDLNPMFKGGSPTLQVEKDLLFGRRLTVIPPDTWDNVYAYTWDPEALGNYPGKAMKKTDDGYQLFISAELTNLVLSTTLPNGTRVNSADIRLIPSNKDVVLRIREDLLVEPDYGQPTEPWDLESLALAGQGLPDIALWDPADPAGDMHQLGTYTYEKYLTCAAGTAMEFKIAGNDRWQDQWNFGGNGAAVEVGRLYTLTKGPESQNLTMTVSEDCTLRLVVDLSEVRYGGNATLLVEKILPSEPAPTRKLTVVVPDDWTRAYAYTWGPDTFGSWPGTELPKNGNTCQIMIPQELVNLVISGELSTGLRQQSHDIQLQTNGEDVTVRVNGATGDYTVVYGQQPSVTYRVVGNTSWMGNWDAASDAGLMTEIEPRKFQKCFKNVQPGIYEYQITKNGTWDGAYGDAGDNCILNVGQTCDVTFTLTISIYGELDSLDVDCVAILAGDMNGDGRRNMGDVAKLYAHIRGSQPLGQEALGNADFTGDGKINMGDTAGLYAHIRRNI